MSKKDERDNQKQEDHDSDTAILGFAWYSREQWNRLLEVSSDRDQLEDTYEEWKSTAEKRFDELARPDFPIQKVDIDVEELLSWCSSQDRPVDGEARAQFAAMKLREREKNK
jgi:hypothetical protein